MEIHILYIDVYIPLLLHVSLLEINIIYIYFFVLCNYYNYFNSPVNVAAVTPNDYDLILYS